jgi:hypothetical protein
MSFYKKCTPKKFIKYEFKYIAFMSYSLFLLVKLIMKFISQHFGSVAPVWYHAF